MLCGEFRADIEETQELLGRKATIRDYENNTWAIGLLGKALSAATYARAARQLQRTSRQIGRFFQDYDVLLTPTLAMPPVETGTLMPTGVQASAISLLGSLNAGGLFKALGFVDTAAEDVYDFAPYTILFNATGQPAMSVPLHWNQAGLPIGMHFVGHFAAEATLFRLAAQLEEARPWFDRSPPVCS
jgi:amidase